MSIQFNRVGGGERTFWWHVYAKTITGKLLSVSTAPAQWMNRSSPPLWTVSPLMKCARTRITKYPIEIRAITLVYFRESNLRRNEIGMTMSLEHVSS